MIGTLQAALATVVALLPGAAFLWSFENRVGRWGIDLPDRLIRFVAGSAVVHLALAPMTYALWRTQLASGSLDAGDTLPLHVWAGLWAYLLVPVVFGLLVGTGIRREWRWITFVTGAAPAPRAWDHLFWQRPVGWVRVKLKSGAWLGGAFTQEADGRSYASGYPHGGDLYLVRTVRVDPDTGAFLYDEDGRLQLMEAGILVRWEEMEFLEFIRESD